MKVFSNPVSDRDGHFQRFVVIVMSLLCMGGVMSCSTSGTSEGNPGARWKSRDRGQVLFVSGTEHGLGAPVLCVLHLPDRTLELLRGREAFTPFDIQIKPSVVCHSDDILSRTALARRIFAKICSALAVQIKDLGFSLCSAM